MTNTFNKQKAREEVLRRFPKLVIEDDMKKNSRGFLVRKKMLTDSIGPAAKNRIKKTLDKMKKAHLFFERRMQGESLESIAKDYNVSRERIRQIVRAYYPDAVIPRSPQKRRLPLVIKYCVGCNKRMAQPGSTTFLKRQYCSRKCRMNDPKIPHPTKMNKKQFREFNNMRTKAYYHSHKDEPYSKLKIWRYNQRTRIKRLLKSRMINQDMHDFMYKKIDEHFFKTIANGN